MASVFCCCPHAC